MADSATLKTPELAAFLKEIEQLPQRITQRLLKGTVATGCTVIRQEAILRAPLYTGKVSEGHPPPGTLKKAIYQTRIPSACSATLEVWKVDVRKGERFQAYRRRGGKIENLDAFYASFVEYGTFKMSARPFMRPAFEAKKHEAVQAMGAYFTENLAAAIQGMRFIKARR